VTRYGRSAFRPIGPLLSLALLAACGGGDEDPGTPPSTSQFQVQPATGTTLGTSQSISLQPEYKTAITDIHPIYLAGTQVQWSSSRPDVAAVDQSGTVTGIAAGEAIISAAFEGLTRQITIKVSGAMVDLALQVPGQGLRTYSAWVPADASGGPALPALLALHGTGGDAGIHASMTLLNGLAARERLLVVYLEGTGSIETFNAGHCCGYAASSGIDDVAYVRAVLDDLSQRYPVDSARVYATGFSNGGMMTHRLACELSDRLAGIAAVSGSSTQRDGAGNIFYACNPVRPIPVLHVHATNDRIVPYLGGQPVPGLGPNFQSVDATIADRIPLNNVTAQSLATAVTSSMTCYRYAAPADALAPSAPVELCRHHPVDDYDPVTGIVYGGGHSWPGGLRSPVDGSDVPVQDFQLNEYLWDFLRRSAPAARMQYLQPFE
jgi:polyhydroxybutyrate depolymerase